MRSGTVWGRRRRSKRRWRCGRFEEQLIPPTINFLPDEELDLDYVPGEARAARLENVLSASFGFGGTNNALILRRLAS